VARSVARLVEGDLSLAVGFARYHGPCALVSDQRAQAVGVVSLVAEEIFSTFELSQQFGRCGDVMDIAGSEQKAKRTADYIGEGVDFGGVPAAREADLLFFGPPFPPNAERWALM